ncbi:DUF4214 domain-containing protein [Candidatus Arthromitus sp. SFB-turkey]|uniref:DUF4214 domain-containing protein n=1 Tax=Candidatus Arthromitus sp. SFB-turkey TaxID=1840217 RepID=UPI0007F4A2D7|nr:DUF4214 domain-containing protein [Candidatus Arthromitus sp. SFB-turkey]OAT87213.1 hypothetical protein A6P36_01075 [Candidatus Arthromitus sp. SFB-turkey]
MFDKFKNLARLLSFVFIFNFLVLNFGIKPKEVKAAEISSIKTIIYDVKVIDNYIVFDFSKYLSEGDSIEELSLLKGNTGIEIQASDSSKKSWRTREVLINGTTYQLNIKANIGGDVRKLVSTFVYNDYDISFKPTMAISGNNIECDLKTWAAKFPEDLDIDVDILLTSGSVAIEKVTKTIKYAKSNKIVFENKKSSLDTRGYVVRARVAGREYLSKFYYSGKWAKNLNVELVSGESKGNNLFNIKLKINMGLSNGDTLRLYAGGNRHNEGVHEGNNVYKFENVEMSFNRDYHIRVESQDRERIRESMFSFCSLSKIEKLGCKADLSGDSSLNFDLSTLDKFLSIQSTNNKIYVYELGDNFSKGTKIGEKVGGLTASNNNVVNLNNGVSLSTSKNYLVELTNGSNTISTPFLHVTMSTSGTEVKETSVKINWIYPTGYTPESGHKVEIYLRDKQNSKSYSAIPDAALVHGTGSGKVDLNKTTSTLLTGLAPGTNYEAKIILNNQRGSVISFTNFTTKTFVLTGPIEIKDANVGNDNFRLVYPRSRTITIQWDFEPSNMEFSSGDKLEIFVKPNTSSEFSGYPKTDKYTNPLFIKTENLNSIKSATVSIPSWMVNFHVDLIYTIGGKKVITSKKSGEQGEVAYNRRTVNAKVNKPKLEVTDITQTTAKVKWEYDRDHSGTKKYEPENGQVIEVNLKKINSLNDRTTGGFVESNRVLWFEHGSSGENMGDLLTKKEFDLTGLEVGQHYRVRVRHILQKGGFDGTWKFVEEFYNFQTGAFTIENLKAEQQTEDSRQIKLTWGTNGTPNFGEGGEDENIKVYLKESNTSDYPQNPETVTIQPYSAKNSIQRNDDTQIFTPTKQCIINLPKYNTPYTAKVEYNLRGKKIEEHVLIEARGDISLNISNITIAGATVTCNLPSGYKKKDTDKVKITVNKELEKSNVINDIDMIISDKNATYDINSNVSQNDICNVVVKFENSGKIVGNANGSFKATTDFQITDINVSDIKANTAKLNWDFTPSGKLDSAVQDEKVEIYLKRNDNKKSSDPDDALTEFTKIYTLKQSSLSRSYEEQENEVFVRSADQIHSQHKEEEGNIKDFKKLDLKNLKVGSDYSIKVKYVADTTLSTDTNAKKEAEFRFKTVSDVFKATVFTSNQTTATYGWEYPPGYELQKGDKVDIFIKELKEDGQSNAETQPDGLGYTNPLLTLVHGIEEGKYNLNEVTRVDVSGLTPEKKYKSKIKFTMSGGHETETEVDISTKSFEIKSFEVDSYEEYDILVKWEIEPENMIFNPADKAEIFVKLASSDAYPEEPSYRLTSDGENNISNTFSDYVLAESIGVEQNMKLVYTVGDKKYEKELTFKNSIDPLKAKVFSVNETRALIEVETPSNYEFVNGDALLIYAKDEFSDGNVQSDGFLVFEGVQSDTLSIADDMKLIELSYLLPEAKYDIVVALDLEDGTVEPVKLELFTEALPITDIKLESINYDGSTISWDYGENPIDFYKDENDDFTDKLLVGVKESDGTPIPDDFNAIKQIAVEEHSGKDIANVKNAKIKVEDKTKDYEVAICCDIGGLSYIKKTKLSFLSVSVDETSVLSDTAKVIWKYPSNITFGDSDKTEVFVRKKDESNYPESPAFSSTGSGTTSYDLTGLEGSTEYIVKVQITKEGLTIDPVEAEFTTKGAASSEVVVDQPEYEITGTAAEIAIPNAEELDIDLEQPIGLVMGDEAFTGFSIKFNESGTGFTIEPTIPKKKYENIEVEIPLKDGTTFKMSIKEFTTQPADTAQDWLSNAYWFAFERFPDEEGYNYWYAHRILPKTLNGEYFLNNLLFAENEFTNRNLQDKELIAALYQIVVNREYDEEGLNFWVGIYNENLQNAQGDKKLAQEVLVDRMAHEPEFGKLCERVGIFWRQSDQDAAGVPS